MTDNNHPHKTSWKIIARHTGWATGCTITESVSDDDQHRFTATIRGYRNWRIWQGKPARWECIGDEVSRSVREIRDRIDAGDKTVFDLPQAW